MSMTKQMKKDTTRNSMAWKTEKIRLKRSWGAIMFFKVESTLDPHWRTPAGRGTVRLTQRQWEGEACWRSLSLSQHCCRQAWRCWASTKGDAREWVSFRGRKNLLADWQVPYKRNPITIWLHWHQKPYCTSSKPSNSQISRTPHESLALKQSSFRQFFRLVTSQVSLWYSNHSTPNPLGVVPDPGVTRVVTGDKFSEEGVELVEEIDDLKKKKHKRHKHKHLQKHK